MPIEHVFASIAVTDLGAAHAWYELLLGGPPDAAPNDREAVWHLADGASLYVVADPARAGKSELTLIVGDLDAHVRELAQRGLRVGEIENAPGLYRKATLSDEDGNRIELGEVPGEVRDA